MILLLEPASETQERSGGKQYPWIIHGSSMDNPWIIDRLSMDHPWIAMYNPWTSLHFHGLPRLGEPVWHVGGSGQQVFVDTLGRASLTHSLYRK
jgi:hypothetical protein